MKTILLLGALFTASFATAKADGYGRYDSRDCDRGGYRDHDRGYRETSYYEHRGSDRGYGYGGGRDDCDRPRRLSVEAQAQVRLSRLGYYYGAIDGSFGYGSQRALYRFQRDHDLPVTGCLDWRTRRALGV